MSEAKLPLTIEPRKFAEKRLILQGKLPLKRMSRLSALCYPGNDLGEASVWIEGNVDIQGLLYFHGTVHANVPLTCQRCLKRVIYALSTEFYLSPVGSEEEAALLPSNYEAIQVQGNEISLLDLIEDELLLVLPIVPKHDETACEVELSNMNKVDSVVKEKHPFAELAKLKKRSKDR